MNRTVSAIVPAYNEEKQIAQVLRALIHSKLITEVVCVSDGSTDNTVAIAQKIPRVTVIALAENHGKAYAVAQGVKRATGNIVLLIDADLTGVTERALSLLIKPMFTDTYDAVVGFRASFIERKITPALAGERAYFKKDIIKHVRSIENIGFGLELYLNYVYKDKRVKYIILPHIEHLFKLEKRPFFIGIYQEIRAWEEILREVIRQKNALTFFYYAFIKFFFMKKSTV